MVTLCIGVVGRQDELARLAAFLTAAESSAQALVVDGEAGIGKSTLFEATLAEARGRGFAVFWCRPAVAETVFSFAALADLLEAVLPQGLERLPAPQRRALAAALLLEEVEGPPPEEHAIAVATLALLREERRASLLIALDDVQWLDAPSASVLAYAVRRLAAGPVAILVARRTNGQAGIPLGLDRAFPDERLQRLQLGALSVGATHRLLRERLGLALPRPGLTRLHEIAGGNPFYALELARALQRGAINLEAGERLPLTLDALVHDRLAALAAETRTALALAAAAAHPTVEIADAGALAPALAAQVIELDGNAIRFTHPLLASAAYAAASPDERRGLHRRLAELAEEDEERARHLALAADGPDATVAAALEHAAAGARARGAPAAAAGFFEQAARLTPADAPAEMRRRRIAAAFHHFESGDSPRAKRVLGELVEELPAGPERALALARLARVRSFEDILAAANLFLQAADEAGEDEVVRALAHEGACSTLFRLRERLADAVEHGKAAARLARAHGNAALEAEALSIQALTEAIMGREQASETMRAALEQRSATERLRVLGRPELHAAVVEMWTDRLDESRAHYLASLVAAGEIGDESSLPYILVLLAQAECVLGDFEAAALHADEGYERAEQSRQESVQAYLLAARALADAHLGRVEAARAAADEALQLAERTAGRPAEHIARWALGLLELSLGSPAETVRVVEPLVAFARAERMDEPGATRFATDLIEALVVLERQEEAEVALAWYEGNARRLSRHSCLAASARCRALLHAARGELPAATAELERALEEHRRYDLPFDRARTLLACGATSRRVKQKRAAREALEQALSIFEELRAPLWAGKARAELARIGGRTAFHESLTPTERRVAELAAEGKTNREVAATLFVTVKAVEATLTRAYAKLGIRRRGELAGRLARGDL